MQQKELKQQAPTYEGRARNGMTEATDTLPAVSRTLQSLTWLLTKRTSYAHLTRRWHHGSNLQISRIFKCSSLFTNRQF